jgi:hypothetical protein
MYIPSKEAVRRKTHGVAATVIVETGYEETAEPSLKQAPLPKALA